MGGHDDIRYLLRRVSELETRLAAIGGAADGGPAFIPKDDPLDPSPYVREIWSSGYHSLASKTYKDEAGVGLKEAVARVEALGK